ncbi:MAG TPA: asparagine synthase (glutamine-hydrolyzing) [Pyrinomonadaceae bacterium]|nr:asparagine synthase (glutamine-hydrolyzing) [Pyrinomonadaceae bacterium]
MCGIAGLISHDPAARMPACLAAIEHRGRDDEGVYLSEPFGASRACLGHRRLSIIDTSAAGHQPMLTEDRRYALILNGEIYNYRELKTELESAGESFHTASDTEVLLKAFRKWGAQCLDKLNGMFAFAVWDDVEKQLTLARDRAGIKPLFYAETADGFAFGSEIKAILASGLITAELDHESLNQALTFLWPVPPRTMFRGVSQLLPGHYGIWRDGKFTTHEWWDLDFSVEEKAADEKLWTERVVDTLDRVTDLEMVADVPVGAFLSGGVDSSSIVAMMKRHTSGKVSAYTTGISADDLAYDIIPDDVEWSRKVAKLLDINYHETLLTPDLADLLPLLVRHQEAPIIDMAIPSYLISKQARATETVMLSGMGGDEVFAGYPRQMAMQLAGITDVVPMALRRPVMSTIESLLPGGRKGRFTAPMRNAKKFARSAAMDFEERYLGFGTYFTDEMKRGLYVADLGAQDSTFDAYSSHREHFEKCRDVTPLNRLLYVDFKTFMPALNLDTTDRTSMAANLEVRVPFLNKEMLDLTARLPSSLKIKGLKRKYILKKAAEQVLPRDVVWRKKAGFGAPIRSWLRGGLKPMVDELLSGSQIRSRGLFDPSAVRSIIEANLSGREDYNLHVFFLLTLELWFCEFLDK